MTTISRTLARHHTGTRRHANRSLWYDAGIALAIVLAVLVMAVAVSQGKPGIQSYHEWRAVTSPAQVHGWEDSAPPGLFPLSPIPEDELTQ